ncbi:MAG: hypothetical protein OXH63_14010 [Gemmatimonadetes bacterium]|nr:hypothetical protein [Gemmatimonadota bacterium]
MAAVGLCAQAAMADKPVETKKAPEKLAPSSPLKETKLSMAKADTAQTKPPATDQEKEKEKSKKWSTGKKVLVGGAVGIGMVAVAAVGLLLFFFSHTLIHTTPKRGVS